MDANNGTDTVSSRVRSNVGVVTLPEFLVAVVFSESAVGLSAGAPPGEEVGGAGGERSGDGAEASAEGLGASASGAGAGEVSGAGPGAGEGALPKSSAGRSTLSTVKMQSGVESMTVEATRDESTPVSRVTESPEVSVLKSNFPAPFAARVENGSLAVFNVPKGVYAATAWYCNRATISALLSLLRSGKLSPLNASSLGAKIVNPLSAAFSKVLITPEEINMLANVLHPAFSSAPVML